MFSKKGILEEDLVALGRLMHAGGGTVFDIFVVGMGRMIRSSALRHGRAAVLLLAC